MREQEPEDVFFEEGAVVRLKSGGPPMSVRKHDREGGGINVTWFFRGRIGEATYRAHMLERCKGSEEIALGVAEKRGPRPKLAAEATD